jgi:hypothetical protein
MVLIVKSLILCGVKPSRLGYVNEVIDYTFLVTGIASANLIYLNAVTLGTPLNNVTNELRDLGINTELYILGTIISLTGISDFKKKVLVIELTYFPYISCYIDTRDLNQIIKDDNDEFTRDVLNLWNIGNNIEESSVETPTVISYKEIAEESTINNDIKDNIEKENVCIIYANMNINYTGTKLISIPKIQPVYTPNTYNNKLTESDTLEDNTKSEKFIIHNELLVNNESTNNRSYNELVVSNKSIKKSRRHRNRTIIHDMK